MLHSLDDMGLRAVLEHQARHVDVAVLYGFHGALHEDKGLGRPCDHAVGLQGHGGRAEDGVAGPKHRLEVRLAVGRDVPNVLPQATASLPAGD